jgi:sec-independent protein translocase protein TatA
MSTIGPTELIIILVILLLLFGANRLAGLGAAAGKTIKEFRKAMSDVEDEIKDSKPPKPSA